IVERLAHAHHHDIGDEAPAVGRHDCPFGWTALDPVAETVARDEDLPDDLAGREITHQAVRAGMTERAGKRATDLTRHAKRSAIRRGDIDAFDLVRPLLRMLARQSQQPFAGAVDRHLLGDNLRPGEREMTIEDRAKVFRYASHFLEAGGAADVEPMPQLLH